MLRLYIQQRQILKISPKSQITIPKKYRDLCDTGNCQEVSGDIETERYCRACATI